MAKKTGLAIVNRSFWPKNQVIGEALLRFAEHAAKTQSVCVITQSSDNLRQKMDEAARGNNVELRACRALTTSSSGLIKRSLEAVLFMLWTFISLVAAKPAKVYVATDPPVLVPFIVFVYCKLFRAEYYYHLQDIHPEAANIVVPLNRWLFGILRWVDNQTLRNATALITLTDAMSRFIKERSGTLAPIYLLDNPSFSVGVTEKSERKKDVVFCGNAGRLQRIPLLIEAMRSYLKNDGRLNFTFAGAGVYAPQIESLAKEFKQVTYLGFLPAQQASDIVSEHRWALLPIDDEVTHYAFPSKSSSYVLSGCNILAICGQQTSVANWISEHQVGISCEPEHDALVACFRTLEEMADTRYPARAELLERLDIDFFVSTLAAICGVECQARLSEQAA